MATRSLAFLGAEVIKVEAPTRPDVWRASLGDPSRFPDQSAGGKPYNRSALFNTQNHDKLSIGVDLKQPAGLALVEALAARSDVVVSNFSPGVMERLGLGYARLRELNERVVDVEMPAFRSASDLAGHVGMGKTMEAASGMVSLIGYEPDGCPVPTGPAYLDPIGGLHGATAILLGYLRVVRSGRGSYFEVAQTDAATRWIGEYVLEQLATGATPPPRGNTVRGCAPHDAFPCRGEDAWVAIGVPDDAAWARLVELTGDPRLREPTLAELSGRHVAAELVWDRIARWTRVHDKVELAHRLQAHGILAAPVNNGADVHRDATLRAVGSIVELTHPEAGTHDYPGLAFRLERTPGAVRRPSPTFGQHNDDVLRGVLGLERDEIDELRREQVLFDDPVAGELGEPAIATNSPDDPAGSGRCTPL
jgi:crotonobetainyl-CoA:carnitine CoA-transferase CaiB-like acyl-CoA transferase